MYTVHTLSTLRMNNNTKATFAGNKVFQNIEDLSQCLLFGDQHSFLMSIKMLLVTIPISFQR